MTAHVTAAGLSIPGRLSTTSLELRAGELTCLVGPNGSGKTSLLHALSGIGRASGEVRIDGVDPRRMAPAQRMKLLSYLPASREANWPLKARDLIALGCSAEEDAQHIPELLEDLCLAEFADRRVDRMSTGERSRVLIARALVSRARLLLLDEPAANLDPLWQLRLMEYLSSLGRNQDQCLLVALHDLQLARQYANRLIIMDRGRIAADGSPTEIFASAHIREIFGIEEREGRWIPAF